MTITDQPIRDTIWENRRGATWGRTCFGQCDERSGSLRRQAVQGACCEAETGARSGTRRGGTDCEQLHTRVAEFVRKIMHYLPREPGHNIWISIDAHMLIYILDIFHQLHSHRDLPFRKGACGRAHRGRGDAPEAMSGTEFAQASVPIRA